MYIETGLGQAWRMKRRPKKVSVKRPPKEGTVVKDDHWRWCAGSPSKVTGAIMCDLYLKVKFRSSFEEFLRDVENAYGRWMERPTARMLIKKSQKTLQQWHQDMVNKKLYDNDPIKLEAILKYRRSNGRWFVGDSLLDKWSRLIDL
jgi:hypothetical protein